MGTRKLLVRTLLVVVAAWAPTAAHASPIIYSNLTPNNLLGAASRPDSPGVLEIEAADDFILGGQTSITKASFIGIIPLGAVATDLNIEMYRVFPNDSDATRTPNVPTRANSPSDVAFAERGVAGGGLSFSMTVLNPDFAVNNTVVNGIFPKPNNLTQGEGPARGEEVRFDVTFLTPFLLPGDHFFFVPQVGLNSGNFLWLSAARPVAGLNPDLQAWIRNGNLDPDWLRIGTDIIGGGSTFNMAFQLEGDAVPEPATLALVGTGLLAVARARRRRA